MRARGLVGSTSLPRVLSFFQILSSSVPEKCLFLPSYSLINLLRKAQDSDLMQIEEAFKDPEHRFWEKNSSEGIVGNSEVQSNPTISNSLWSHHYLEVIFLSLHLKSTSLFWTCQWQSTRRNSQATSKEWGPSIQQSRLSHATVCLLLREPRFEGKQASCHSTKVLEKTKSNRALKDFPMQQHLLKLSDI